MNYEIAKKDFEKTKILFHFTDFESLKLILETKTFRLSRISNLDDKEEKKYIPQFFRNKVFTMSFTSCIKEYFWNEYTKGMGKKGGVIIKISNNNKWYFDIQSESGFKYNYINKTDVNYKSYDNAEDWGIYDISGLKVCYKDNPLKDYTINREILTLYSGCSIFNDNPSRLINIENPGYVKESKWDIEEEFRIRVTMRPKGFEESIEYCKNVIHETPFTYIYLNMQNNFDLMEILISSDFEYKDELFQICSSIGIKCTIID